MIKYTDEEIILLIQKHFKNKKINILSPIVRSRKVIIVNCFVKL